MVWKGYRLDFSNFEECYSFEHCGFVKSVNQLLMRIIFWHNAAVVFGASTSTEMVILDFPIVMQSWLFLDFPQ